MSSNVDETSGGQGGCTPLLQRLLDSSHVPVGEFQGWFTNVRDAIRKCFPDELHGFRVVWKRHLEWSAGRYGGTPDDPDYRLRPKLAELVGSARTLSKNGLTGVFPNPGLDREQVIQYLEALPNRVKATEQEPHCFSSWYSDAETYLRALYPQGHQTLDSWHSLIDKSKQSHLRDKQLPEWYARKALSSFTARAVTELRGFPTWVKKVVVTGLVLPLIVAAVIGLFSYDFFLDGGSNGEKKRPTEKEPTLYSAQDVPVPLEQAILSATADIVVEIESDKEIDTTFKDRGAALFLARGKDILLALADAESQAKQTGGGEVRYVAHVSMSGLHPGSGKKLSSLASANRAVIQFPALPAGSKVIRGRVVLVINGRIRLELPFATRTYNGKAMDISKEAIPILRNKLSAFNERKGPR